MYAQAAVNDPVLYIGLYSTGDVPSEVDDYHWVFIVGPSHEEAGSEATLYSMEPRHHNEWCWSYNQCIVPLQDLSALLVRLMVAEVVDMDMLQMTMLRWAGEVRMRVQVEWMSVRWVQRVLKGLEEDEGCLGKKMKSFESVEAEGRRLAEMEEKKQNVDIAIRSPVLYAAVHPNYRPPCKNDESHWAFLSGPAIAQEGPANKTAESKRAGHVVEVQLDSGGRPFWGYSQTAIPLPDGDDLRVRMLIADIAKMGLLGEMVRDLDVTPTVDRTTFAGNLKSKTFLRIQESIEMLERQPDCFTFKFHKSSMCEEVSVKEVTSNQPGAKPWWPFRPGRKTFCLLRASKMPDHDEAEIVVNMDLSLPEPITMTTAIQIVISALGAAAMALRRQNAAREQREKKSERKCEPIAKPREIAVRNSWFQQVQRLDQEKIAAENEVERERAPSWFNVAAKEGEDERGRGKDEVGEEEKKEGEEEEEEDDDEGEDRRDEEDVESRDGNDVNEMLDEEAGEKTSTSRPALVRSRTILFADFNKPGSAAEGEKLVKEEGEKDKDVIESDEDEDDDEDDDDEDDDDEDDEDEDDDGDGDSKDSSEEDEDDDDDDHENEEDSSDEEDDDEDDSNEDEDDDYENGHEQASPNHRR